MQSKKSDLARLGIIKPFDPSANEGNNISLRAPAHRQEHYRWTPPFAFSDSQLRAVLFNRAVMYLHNHGYKFVAEFSVAEYAAADAAATKMALRGYAMTDDAAEMQINILAAHRRAVRRAGSYLSLQAAIAWRAWREGRTSTDIAAELKLSPAQIRQNLRRLRGVAGRLGFAVGRRALNLKRAC